jgi:ABC-type multidrug transport system permease subunit
MNRNPLLELSLIRLKLFFREPEALFWTYGFPLIMVIALGLAFRNKPEVVFDFDVMEGPAAEAVQAALSDNARFKIAVHQREGALERLRRNKTLLVVALTEDGKYEYHFDPTNPESRVMRATVDDALQRAAGREDRLSTVDEEITARGSRYIDFLVPGLIGMNLMGGGLWGVGFVLVDMRVRKLLKRMVATPMRRRDFLLSMVGVRAFFFVPEMVFLLLAAYLIFQVPVQGSLLLVALIGLIGSLCFAGMGLLVACRAKRIETAAGLMNLIMLPMWLLSGIFFSAERFPGFLQPFIQSLPLTQLNNALRAVILDGAGVAAQLFPMLVLVLWGGVSFVLALRWFRWSE